MCLMVRIQAEDSVQTHCHEKTIEDIKDFMCTAVTMIFRMCKAVRLLELLLVI